jgi:hypothetical protein
MAKRCNKCLKLKPVSAFTLRGGKRYKTCKQCQAETWERNKLAQGFSREEIQELRAKKKGTHYIEQRKEQRNCCAICERPETKGKVRSSLVRDHCHKTGKSRGLLCDRCNILLGRVDEDILFLRKIISYLCKIGLANP